MKIGLGCAVAPCGGIWERPRRRPQASPRASAGAARAAASGLVASGFGLLLAVLGGLGLALTAGCHQREATAKRIPVLYVPPNPPTEAPPPAPLLIPEAPTPPAQPPAQHAPPDNVPLAKASTEIPCEVAPPPGMVCIPGGPFWRGHGNPTAARRPRTRTAVTPPQQGSELARRIPATNP